MVTDLSIPAPGGDNTGGERGFTMKKVINGKPYDTQIAEKLAEYSYGQGPRDFTHFTEKLYRKRTGEYFLYGEGGPMSKYSVETAQNSWSGSERITPLSISAAQEWAEKVCDGDEYEKIFGAVEEEKVQVTGWVPQVVKDAADELKKTRGIKFADIYAAGVAALKETEGD